MLGRLQLGAVGWLEHEPDAVRHHQVLGAVPAGVVELKHDALALAGTRRGGEIGKHAFEVSLADVVRNVPHRLPCHRLDEARDVKPFEAVMAERDRPLADRGPYAARDRLQADAMLVGGPDLNRRAGVLALLLRCRPGELFLSAARSLPLAAAGWRGRGCWME
jgi:hypothetical protein